jgi:hypothetical protein
MIKTERRHENEKTRWKSYKKSGTDAENHAIYHDEPHGFHEYV